MEINYASNAAMYYIYYHGHACFIMWCNQNILIELLSLNSYCILWLIVFVLLNT